MRYPFVFIFRYAKYAQDIDPILESTKSTHLFSYEIISNAAPIYQMFDSNNHVLLTVGPKESEYVNDVNQSISPRLRFRWLHQTSITSESITTLNYIVKHCYIYHAIQLDRSQMRPRFSMFTTTFHSYHRILRCYESLKRQTFRDWEWVIIDDSADKNDNHFTFLKSLFQTEAKVRLYRRSENNGSIGCVKNEASSLCRGKYILEMDHDDELLPDVLENAVRAFESDDSIGFVYMDTSNIHENGNNYHWGEFISKGYGGYYCQKFRDKWIYVYMTPNINNNTLSHIVCVPNHPRIWRRDVLSKIGGYCEMLPICDDLELILRTATQTKIAKVDQLAYIQYMNDGGNNFTWIRNDEICRLGPFIVEMFNKHVCNVDEKMKELGAYENSSFGSTDMKNIWMRDDSYEHKYCNTLLNYRFDEQYCILGLDSLYHHLDLIREKMAESSRIDFLLVDNRVTNEYLWQRLDSMGGLDRIKCYALHTYGETKKNLLHYFHRLYRSCPKYVILDVMVNTHIPFNTSYSNQGQIINASTKPEDIYLEIGIETGGTFTMTHFLKKTGVDPDPKISMDHPCYPFIACQTSDAFFEEAIQEGRKYNVIFLDGMHQAEFLLRDLNHSLQCLTSAENGTIFIDDILPANEREQRKIPTKHYYSNGILKYGEPGWTGDIWKVVYYLLRNHGDKIKQVTLFHHINYRGVIQLTFHQIDFQLDPEHINEINGYSYFEKDFEAYLQLLAFYTKHDKK